MIRVPTVDQASITPQAMPDAHIGNQVSAAGMGGDIASGLQSLGDATDQIYEREQYKANGAAGDQMRIDLANNYASLTDPSNPNSIYQFKGINAQQAPGFVRQQLQDFYTKYQQNLKNPVQQQMFSRLFAAHQLGVLDRVNHYALNQTDAYQLQAHQGAVGSALLAATSAAQAGDPEGALQAQLDGIASIKQYGAANGWAPEYTQSSIDRFTKTIQAANEAANKAQVLQGIIQDPNGMLHELGARLGIAQYSPANQAISQQPGAARGIRNNNPGNIQQSGIAWQGKVASADPRYEAFASPQLGIRALGVNAISLQDKGAQSVAQLVTQWAPPSENGPAKTQAYIDDVSHAMGVDPNANVDLRDPATLTAFTNAIITHENNGNPYSPDVVQSGVQAALGKQKLADAHPPVTTNASGLIVPGDGTNTPITSLQRTGNLHVDALNTADAIDLYNRAREEVNRGKLNARAGIEQRVRDDNAAFQNGQTVQQPLTEADFTGAYGDVQGMQAYGAYQANQQLGQDLQTVATLTPDQMNALAKARQPTPGENYAVKQADQDHLVGAMQRTMAARQKDPVAWAQQANVGGVQPLDMAPDKLGDALATRAGQMQALSATYQMAPTLLSSPERAQLAAELQQAPPAQKAQMLGAITGKLSQDEANQVLQAIQPDAPVLGYAGRIMAAGRAADTGTTGHLWWQQPTMQSAADVAQTMLTGQQLISPTKTDKQDQGAAKFTMPADGGATGLRSEWSAVVGDAYRGDGQGAMQGYQAFRAMYAGLASKAGISDGTLNPQLATEAARATIGNVTDWNGHQVIPPYGMDANTFKDAVNAQWSATRANVPGADQQEAGAYTLDTLSPGVYGMSNGGAPLLDKHGAPVVLRINAANAAQIAVQAQKMTASSAPATATAAAPTSGDPLNLPRMEISE